MRYLAKYKYILIFALFLALAAGFFAWRKAEKFDVSVALTISRYGTQSAQDYKYDNYYALKATDEFGNTVAGWLKTPEITQAVYKRAGLTFSSPTLDSLSRKFKAVKISPNLVEARFSAKNEDEGQRMAQALGQIIAEKANLLNASSWQGISFLVVAGEPTVVKNKMTIWWNMLAGLLIGLVFGFFVQVSKEYFRE
jgi:capsular polysaccharide biosynthesis protein